MARHKYIRDSGILNTDKNRFLSNIYLASNSDCLEWRGTIKQNGYGQFKTLDKKWVHAHRYSFEFFIDKIPEGLCILHSCDNRKCVNPNHLFLGTQKENIHDMIRKKRKAPIKVKGTKNPNVKLSNEDVLKIRKIYSKELNCTKISKIYNVSISAIDRIVRRKSWSHLE